MTFRKSSLIAVIAMLLVFVLAACATQEAATPTPTDEPPTATPEPTDVPTEEPDRKSVV